MTFLSILLSFSPDQMRLSEDFGDYIAYDQAILFNEYITPDTFAVSFELKAKESLPVIKDSFPNFDEETTIGKFLIIDSGFYSFFLTKVAQFFIELFTIKNYSGTNLATLIGLVTLGFLFNFCISIRIEVSKIRLTFLSFISIIFTFFILLTALQILNGVAPLAVFNSKNDTFVLTAFATNVAKMVVEPGSFLVGPSDDVEAIQKNLFSDPNALNLYNNSSFRKLTNDIVKLENDVYVKGEYHKSSSLFNKYQIHSSFFETNSLINNGYKIITVKDMALDIMNTVYALVGTNNIDPSRPGDFLDHTPLRHYQSMRGSHFFILSSCFCLFFLLLLFIGFSDQQFLNQNKNFEFI
ncbi:MAG: hypothetical protein GY737_14455 [Desulfobacteraceae bacterium]|nr:hypothetical protein [Desulfobacteraceae bacterium]|tara:strand:- start:2018 stop:3076 length:1059 start_codon:yes stop_codon:yes gene_type:complete